MNQEPSCLVASLFLFMLVDNECLGDNKFFAAQKKKFNKEEKEK